MPVVMTRVDARLIHGQIAVRWSKVTLAQRIVVVDNKTANDEFLSEILMMAAPRGIEVVIYNEDQAVENWNDGYGDKNVFIIFQNVDSAYRCWTRGVKFESLNIGQSHKTPARTLNPNNTVHLSPSEFDELVDLNNNNVEVYFHPTPEDAKLDFESARKKVGK